LTGKTNPLLAGTQQAAIVFSQPRHFPAPVTGGTSETAAQVQSFQSPARYLSSSRSQHVALGKLCSSLHSCNCYGSVTNLSLTEVWCMTRSLTRPALHPAEASKSSEAEPRAQWAGRDAALWLNRWGSGALRRSFSVKFLIPTVCGKATKPLTSQEASLTNAFSRSNTRI